MDQNAILAVIPIIVDEFLNSSSSDSDDEIILKLKKNHEIKITNFLDDIRKFNNREFQQHFRIERRTCIFLIEEFANSDSFMKHQTDGRSETISAELHILYYLWFAGNYCSLKDVSERFNINLSDGYLILERVIAHFLAIASDVISFPKTNQEKQELSDSFYNVGGFPKILGCIKGTSINIRHKINNKNSTVSLTLHGICDAKKKFMDVFTGAPNKINDSSVFKQIKTITNNGYYHLLGDDTYPIREWLLVPYADDGNLTKKQQNFNKKLSETRILIEETFDLLKSRFRQLLNLDFPDLKNRSEFVISCCVLHNLCFDFNDELEIEEEETEDKADIKDEQQLKRLGDIKRNNICEMLKM